MRLQSLPVATVVISSVFVLFAYTHTLLLGHSIYTASFILSTEGIVFVGVAVLWVINAGTALHNLFKRQWKHAGKASVASVVALACLCAAMYIDARTLLWAT